MYLKKANLNNFGHFRNRELEFGSGLNIIMGPNEAGKSTLVEFLRYMVLGKPVRRHPAIPTLDGSAPVGHLWLDDDSVVERKNYKMANGSAAPLALGATPEVFRDVFTFDLEDLRELSNLDNDHALMGALTESIRKYEFAMSRLNARIDQLYRPRATSAILRSLDGQERELLNKLRDAEQKSGKFAQLLAEMAEREATRDRLESERNRIGRDHHYFGQLAENYETWLEQQEAIAGLGAFSPFDLSPSEYAQIRDLDRQVQVEKQQVAVLSGQLLTKKNLLNTLKVDRELLDVSAELRQLATEYEAAKRYEFAAQRAVIEREESKLAQGLKNLGANSYEELPDWTTGQLTLLRDAARLEVERVAQHGIVVEKQQHVQALATQLNELVVDNVVESCAAEIEALPDVSQFELAATRAKELESKIGDLVSERDATQTAITRDAMSELRQIVITVPNAVVRVEQLSMDVEAQRRRLQKKFEAVEAINLEPLDAERVQKLHEAIPGIMARASRTEEHQRSCEILQQQVRQTCEAHNFDVAAIEHLALSGELRSQLEEAASDLQQRKSALASADEELATFSDVSGIKPDAVDASKHRIEKLKLLEQVTQNRATPTQRNRVAIWAMLFSIVVLSAISVVAQNYVVAVGLVVVGLLAIWFWRSGKPVESNQDGDQLLRELKLPSGATLVDILEARQAEEKIFGELATVAKRLELKQNTAQLVGIRTQSLQRSKDRWEALMSALPIEIRVDQARESLNALQEIKKMRQELGESTRLIEESRIEHEQFLETFGTELQAFGTNVVGNDLTNKVSRWLRDRDVCETRQADQAQAARDLQNCVEEFTEAKRILEELKQRATALGYHGELAALHTALDVAQRHFKLEDEITSAENELARHMNAHAPTQNRLAVVRSALEFSGTDSELIQYAKRRLADAKDARAHWRAETVKYNGVAHELDAAKASLEKLEQKIAQSTLTWATAQSQVTILRAASPQDVERIIASVGNLVEAGDRLKDSRSTLAAWETKLTSARDALVAIRNDFGENAPLETWLPLTMNAIDNATTARTQREQTSRDCSELEAEIQSHQTRLDNLESEFMGVLACHDCLSLTELEERREDGQTFEKLKASIDAADRALRAAFGARFEDAISAFRIGDVSAWPTNVDSLRTKEAGLREQMSEVEQNIGVLATTLEELRVNADIPAIEIELAMVRSEIHSAKVELAELLVAKALLEDTLDTYRQVHLPAVLKKASTMIESATNGTYVRLLPNDDGTDILLEDSTGGQRTSTQLSRGTRELVFIAIRLALAMDYASRNVHVPIIMDDVMVNMDEERATQMAKLIGEVGKEHQVFFMTCNPYTSKMLKNTCEDPNEIQSACPNEIQIDRFDGAGQPMTFVKTAVRHSGGRRTDS